MRAIPPRVRGRKIELRLSNLDGQILAKNTPEPRDPKGSRASPGMTAIGRRGSAAAFGKARGKPRRASAIASPAASLLELKPAPGANQPRDQSAARSAEGDDEPARVVSGPRSRPRRPAPRGARSEVGNQAHYTVRRVADACAGPYRRSAGLSPPAR